MRDQLLIQRECITYNFWAEKGSTHPTCVESQVIGHQQHILNGCAQALDRHRGLVGLSFGIWITVHVLKIETGNNEGGSAENTLARLIQACIDDLLCLPIHLEIVLPGCAHPLSEQRLRFLTC